jgi:hypothetical protein
VLLRRTIRAAGSTVKTKKSALQAVKTCVIEWFDWTKSHGESAPDVSDNPKVKVAEILRVNYNPSEAGKPEPLFWSEVAPVTKEDIERTIRLIKYSREDLISTTKNITGEMLDWQPPAKLRPIGNCLKHIAHAELWYLTRLDVPWPEKIPESPTELLNYSRETTLKYLHNFPERKMKGVFQPKRYRSPVCNLWTARKFLRRLVDHEMLHVRDIKKVLELEKSKVVVRD